MEQSKQVAVVIPFYKNELSPYEEIALKQCLAILANYDIIAVKPISLEFKKCFQNKFTWIADFDDEYFASIAGYNKLMLSEVFYERFLSYEYILIHQLDAFVFKDDLKYWCNSNYDYIGAPWIRAKPYSNIMKAVLSKIEAHTHTRYNVKKDGIPSKKQFEYKVGNGGFSLRKTMQFYNLAGLLKPKIELYNQTVGDRYNEDSFWSVEVNRKKKLLNIPDYKVALGFAMENYPERCLSLNNGQLPFGCHAWDKHVDFWHPIFEQYGYQIKIAGNNFNNF